MKSAFHKFPSTPHLTTIDNVVVRGDKVMSHNEYHEFLHHELSVEEKVDGANLGVSFDANGNVLLQNRGAYLHLPNCGQWKKIEEWIALKTESMFEHITERYILFGEWCYARHSVFYNRLPDWFLGFDVYDKQIGKFMSLSSRDKLFKKIKITPVPFIARGQFELSDIKALLSQSMLGDQQAEGLYLRHDQNDWLMQRAKLVHPAFVQSLKKHWSRSAIIPNRLLNARFQK